MDKKLIKMVAIFIGLLILLIVFMLIVNGLSGGKKHTYDEVVSETVAATKKYLAANPSRYPTAGNTLTIVNFATLVDEKYIKPASQLFKNNNANCYGEVDVYYLETNKYDYIPEITCNVAGETKVSSNLSNYLIGDGELNVIFEGSGLYKRINGKWAASEDDLTSGASDDEIYYFYRGNEKLLLKNYVKIDSMLFRVIMIDNDGGLYLLYNDTLKHVFPWDSRYNTDLKRSYGINDYIVNGVKSSAMQKLESFMEGKEYLSGVVKFSESLKYITEPFEVCIGKRSLYDEGMDGSLECKLKVDNQYASLLPTYLYMSASLDPQCKQTKDMTCSNNNYLSLYSNFWLQNTDSEESYYCFYVEKSIKQSPCNVNMAFKPLIKVSSRVQYTSGTGTETDPYILDTHNYVTQTKK